MMPCAECGEENVVSAMRTALARTRLSDCVLDVAGGPVMGALSTFGIILQSDPRLPSVATIIAGEPVGGSCWGHPKGHAICAAIEELQAHRCPTAWRLAINPRRRAATCRSSEGNSGLSSDCSPPDAHTGIAAT